MKINYTSSGAQRNGKGQVEMNDINDEELRYLEGIVANLNSASNSVTYRLIEMKGTYYIYPEFPAKD
jgi:hypothetical protein